MDRPNSRHRQNQEHHFKKRARQRLRLDISHEDYAEIAERIRQDKPGVVFLRHGRQGSTLWRVKWHGVYAVVVFDHRSDRIVTTWRYKRKPWVR